MQFATKRHTFRRLTTPKKSEAQKRKREDNEHPKRHKHRSHLVLWWRLDTTAKMESPSRLVFSDDSTDDVQKVFSTVKNVTDCANKNLEKLFKAPKYFTETKC